MVLKMGMKSVLWLTLLTAVSCSVSVVSDYRDNRLAGFLSKNAVTATSPFDMVKRLSPGINLGNTLDAISNEGDWTGGEITQEYYFDDFVKAGFKSVRIPVTWEHHFISNTAMVEPAFMARVEQVVDWALSRGLVVILDTHHEKWLKNDYANQINRFESLWSQIAQRFSSKSENLLFEILNEPEGPMTNAQVNDMNGRVLSIIRETNPTRIVIVGADEQNSEYRLVSSSSGFVVPQDPYLIATFHNYNPWSFCGKGTDLWGSADDFEALNTEFSNLAAWSAAHNIPLYMGEFGVVKSADLQSRDKWLKTVVNLCWQYGIAYSVWDDYGDFGVYNRKARTFNTGITSLILSRSTFIVPGKIEAENFDFMSGIQTETCSEGTLNVGWIDAGDWLDYKINVLESGTYKVDFRTAGITATGAIDLLIDGIKQAVIPVPNTGGWQNWASVTQRLSITKGSHTLRLAAASGLWNLNHITFNMDAVMSSSSSAVSSVSSSSKSSSSSVSSRSSSSSSSSSSTASISPVTLNSWQCNANSGGLIIWTGGVGGWDAGEWIQFNNVNLGSGYKTLLLNYATAMNGSFDIRLDSATGPTIGTINFGSTGNWNTYNNALCNLDPTRTGVHTLFVRCNFGAANIGTLIISN